MNDFNLRIAAGCDAEGRLKVKMRLLQPGQLQSASVDAADEDATALNEIRGIFKRKPRALNILSARSDNQIGHTEIIFGVGGVASIHWQADNPSLRYDNVVPGGAPVQHRCLFAGTAVGAP